MLTTVLPLSAIAAEIQDGGPPVSDASAPDGENAGDDGISLLSDNDLKISGYTQVTELPSEGLSGKYLIIAPYNGQYYMLYPGGTNGGNAVKNSARLVVGSDGTATGYQVGYGSIYGTATTATDFTAAENTITKNSDGTYSVTATGPSNAQYVLCNSSGTLTPVYSTASTSSVDIQASSTNGYLNVINHARTSYVVFYTTWMNFAQSGELKDDSIGDMMFFRNDDAEVEDGSGDGSEETDGLPGYTQVTRLSQIKPDKKYLIVAQAPDKTFYALYLNEAGADKGPGSNAYPECTANLTISGGKVTAVSAANTATSIKMDDLHVTITQNSETGKYTIKNNTHSLALTSNEMYAAASNATEFECTFVGTGSRFQIYNRGPNRYLTFNVKGSPDSHYPDKANTGFSGWSDPQTEYIPVYLYVEGELDVEPGMNLFNMLSGDQIGGGNATVNDPDGQNSWVFTGGRAAQGSFADVKGARTWAGHFEEYVRYTHAKALQPSGESNTPYFQRHVINAAYGNQTLAEIVSTFDDRIAALKPRAVVYLVGENDGTDSISTNLNNLISKSLGLKNGKGMIVIATLTDTDKAAVDEVVNALKGEQKPNVLSVQFNLTTGEKTGGYPNASGHFAMAKQLTNAIMGTNVSSAANWPYGAINNSVLASGFPNKTGVTVAHDDYGTPDTLTTPQQTVKELVEDEETPATWLFMGDSITHGSAWTGGYDTLAQLFEKFVKDDLDRPQDLVINAGSSGATTASTLSDLNRRLVKYNPDVVVLMLGTNDAAGKVSENTYKANLRTILDKIMDKGAVPVLRTPPPTSRDGYAIADYAQYIRDVANETKYADKVILVDQYARWTSMNWNAVFTRDDLHPDEAGHLWFAHQLIQELGLWDSKYEICKLEYVEMKEQEKIEIPGYTQVTNVSQLSDDKGYLIVSQDAQGNLYALYPSEEGKTLGSGALPKPNDENDGARTASLTVSEDTVTAKWLKNNDKLTMEKLLFTIKRGENNGYIFTSFNGRHLNMANNMFTQGSVALTVTSRAAAPGAFEIKNPNDGGGNPRVLDFSKNGDPNAFIGSDGSTWGTDFWCPRSAKMSIYLFASDTAKVPTAKESIETLIQEDIEGLLEEDYTSASWARLKTALAAAWAELKAYNADSMNGNEPQFVTARDNLQSAYDNLQRKPVIPTVPAGATKIENWKNMVPASGSTKNEPFASGTGGSTKFRIPAIITLKHQTGANASKNGRLLAAIDARWNHVGDACGLDTIVSYSDDNGGNWNYNFPNYFGDSTNAYATYGTAFIDPVLVEGNDGAIYMMVDLWPGGVALNTAPMRPASATGYVEINGTKRLALYTSPVTGSQSDTNYSYYVGGFEDGYAPVYEPTEGKADTFAGYYVDEYYYLYHTEGEFAEKTPANDKIYCQRLGNSEWVQQNVFFYNASLHVRNASYLWIVKSTDGGETWSKPQMINDQVRTGADQFYGVGPGAGLCMDNGMILLPVYIWPDEHAGFIYSEDNGATWHRSPTYATNTSRDSSESCLIQIDDTTVRHFYRDSWSNSMVVRYTDHTWNGTSWTTGSVTRVEGAPRWGACQLSAIKYSKKVDGKDLILYSAPSSTSNRTKGVIHAFLVNDDKTMTLYNTYSVNGDGVYAYSSLTETADGNIALLYESTNDAVIFEIIPITDIIPSKNTSNGNGSSSPSTTTTVEKNPGGSTTTTVTDNQTGAVTVTTENPDGSKNVVETKKDGTVTETKIDAQGGKAEKVSVPDEGITVTDPSGEILVKLELPSTIPELEQKFADVPENHWAEQGILDMAALGVIHGVSNDRYDMNGPIKRADMATMLFCLSNVDTRGNAQFSDVPDDAYYAESVAWASEAGVVRGVGNGQFLPENASTREELAVMLYRYAMLLKLDTTVSTDLLNAFSDGSQTHSWAEDSLAWCVKNHIIQGKDGEILDPRNNATRAEAAVMLQRFLKLIA